MPSHREIAERAGTSTSTVSLVLSNKPGVSDAMRQRVLVAFEELTTEQQDREVYAHPQSSGQANEATSIVVLHSSDIFPTVFFRRLLRGIQSATDQFRVQLRLVSYVTTQIDDLSNHQYLVDPYLRSSGVLIAEDHQYKVLGTLMQKLEQPYVVRIDPSVNPMLPAVGSNEFEAGYQATRHLLDLGHRHIALVGGNWHRLPPDTTNYYVKRRLEGYQMALRENDIMPRDTWVNLSSDSALATHIVLDQNPDLTAILFITSGAAASALSTLDERNLSIPDDLSVIALDDLLDQDQLRSQLTTVYRPEEKKGYWAIKLLLDLIREPELHHGQYTFRVSLIERESCQPR